MAFPSDRLITLTLEYPRDPRHFGTGRDTPDGTLDHRPNPPSSNLSRRLKTFYGISCEP